MRLSLPAWSIFDFCKDLVPICWRKPAEGTHIVVKKCLADRVTLIIIPAARKREQFSFEIS